MSEKRDVLRVGLALLAAVALTFAAACLSGCSLGLGRITVGGGLGPVHGEVGFEFKGTDNDILALTQGNAQAFAAGRFKLPRGVHDRAAVFGNNYTGTSAELHQCVADAARNVVNLVRVDRFDPRGVLLFINEGCSKKNYEAAAAWALGDGGDGRRAFMNSSHGAQDTNADGKIVNVLVTDDMVRTGRWDESTEVGPDFWAGLLRKAKAPWIVLNDSCHSGGQMRASGGARYPVARAFAGPDHVQARVAAAVGTHTPDLSGIKTGTVFAACRADQLANETQEGGAATVAYWGARAELGANLGVKDVIRAANVRLRAGGNTQNMNPVGSVGAIWKP